MCTRFLRFKLHLMGRKELKKIRKDHGSSISEVFGKQRLPDAYLQHMAVISFRSMCVRLRKLLDVVGGMPMNGLRGNLPELSRSVCVRSVARSGAEGGRHWIERVHWEAS